MTQVTQVSQPARYVAAFVPDETGEDAVALGRFLVTGTETKLTVCTVVPHTATGGDAAYGGLGYGSVVAQKLQPIFETLRSDLAPLDISHTVRLAPSVSTGLLDYAAEVGASMLVLGSSRTAASGRYAIGSVAGLLQHASPVPLAFAPQGFAQSAADSVRRIVCGYSESPDSPQALRAAADLCRAHQVPLHLVTFVFPEYPALRNLAGLRPSRADTAQQIAAASQRLDRVRSDLPPDIEVETFVRSGGNISQAVARAEWADGDLLVLGSAPMGPLARVFLGSTALKLLRCCPVPVIAVTRPTTASPAGTPTPGADHSTAAGTAAPENN